MGNEIINTLNGQGLEIEKIENVNYDELIDEGYHKLSENQQAQLDSFLQYIPSIISDAATRKSATNNATKLLDGAYKVSIKDGMHLAKFNDEIGGNLGSLLSNETNKVSGQARWFKIGDKLTVSKVPAYAMGIFNALSVITGQVYLAEINEKLETIEKTTKQIVNYLDNKTKAEMWADNEALDEIYNNMQFAKQHKNLFDQYVSILGAIKQRARTKIKHFELEIKSKAIGIDLESKDVDIQNYVEETLKYYPQYWFAVYLYVKSINCEIVLNEITDPEYIDGKIDEAKKYVSQYVKKYSQDKKKMQIIASKSEVYNKLELPTLEMKTDIPLIDAIVGIYDVVALGKNYHTDKMNDKSKKLITKVTEELKGCGNVKLLESGIQNIVEYKIYMNNPISIVSINDDVYIKYDELPKE